MERVNGVFFNTKKNQYFLDTKSSEILVLSEMQKKIVENYYRMTKELLYKEIVGVSTIEDFEKEYEQVSRLISNGYIYSQNINRIPNYRKEMKKATASQLILVLTEKCNLRCKYCVYSDKYYNTSNFSEKVMTFDTAKSSIDYYLQIHLKKRESGYLGKPQISFYGGEPLIKFDLIKEVVLYIRSIGIDVLYYITTNGVLLSEDIIRFLVDNNFNVTFSLDGYKENHNKNRVTSGGEPTFDTVMSKIDFYSKYSKDKMEYSGTTSFNCCYDYGTDLEKCVEFFAKHKNKFKSSFYLYSQIDPYDSTYYEVMGKEEIQQSVLYKSLTNVKKRFLDINCDTEFREVAFLLFTGMLTIYERNKNAENRFKGACVPYSKLAVYPDGIITMCEKMGKRFPIGNINDNAVNETALDKIVELFYKNFVEGECSSCAYQNLCSVCYVHMNGKGVINSEFCSNQINSIHQTLVDLYTVLEETPEMEKVIAGSMLRKGVQ